MYKDIGKKPLKSRISGLVQWRKLHLKVACSPQMYDRKSTNMWQAFHIMWQNFHLKVTIILKDTPLGYNRKENEKKVTWFTLYYERYCHRGVKIVTFKRKKCGICHFYNLYSVNLYTFK